jgi:hypothetical protein
MDDRRFFLFSVVVADAKFSLVGAPQLAALLLGLHGPPNSSARKLQLDNVRTTVQYGSVNWEIAFMRATDLINEDIPEVTIKALVAMTSDTMCWNVPFLAD